MQKNSEKKEFLVHIICTGNAYRSRLAEAYLNSQQIPGLRAYSSGTRADETFQYNGPICWYAMELINRYQLVPFMSITSQQTTAHLLAQADLTIFICQEHCDYTMSELAYQQNSYQVWEISDIEILSITGERDSTEYLLAYIKSSENTFKLIREKVDQLIKMLNGSR